MAKNETKHKSKYKEPKDFAKSQKPQPRKDLKDYIKDLVRDCMWEFSGEILPGPRKDDKWTDSKTYPFVHNHEDKKESTNMVPDIKDADRAYPIEMMQDGDPKMYAHAKKVFAKNIETDGEEYLKALETRDGGVTSEKLKEAISNLPESKKEDFVRTYIRKKITSIIKEGFIFEQDDAEAPAEPPADAPETPVDAPTDTADAEGGAETETPGAETETPGAETGADLGGSTPSFSGGGGGGGGSTSPSTPPATGATDTEMDTPADPEKEAMASKIKTDIDNFVKGVKNKLATATPLEVAPDVVQPIKDLIDGMTTAKANQFKKAIATALRNADLPNPSPSDDYTENT
jgi:hypothetical protein